MNANRDAIPPRATPFVIGNTMKSMRIKREEAVVVRSPGHESHMRLVAEPLESRSTFLEQ